MEKTSERYIFLLSLCPFALWILCAVSTVFRWDTPAEFLLMGATMTTPVSILCSAVYCVVAGFRKRFQRRMLVPLGLGFLPLLFALIGACASLIYLFYF